MSTEIRPSFLVRLRRPLIGALLIALVAVATTLAAISLDRAAADHIGGVTYTGTHDQGGTVDFDVSADGTGIERFRATALPTDGGCFIASVERHFATPAITDHEFSLQQLPDLSFTGTFPSPGSAEGTVQMQASSGNPFDPLCDTGIINWTASASVPTQSPTPSPTPLLTSGATATPTATPSPGPTGSMTPAPSETPVSTATPSPTASPGPGPFIANGDNDCDGDEDSVDALAGLRHVVGLAVSQEIGCPRLGDVLLVAPAGVPVPVFGDVDCDQDVDAVDSLQVLRSLVALAVNQEPGCPEIGASLIAGG